MKSPLRFIGGAIQKIIMDRLTLDTAQSRELLSKCSAIFLLFLATSQKLVPTPLPASASSSHKSSDLTNCQKTSDEVRHNSCASGYTTRQKKWRKRHTRLEKSRKRRWRKWRRERKCLQTPTTSPNKLATISHSKSPSQENQQQVRINSCKFIHLTCQ